MHTWVGILVLIVLAAGLTAVYGRIVDGRWWPPSNDDW